MLSALFIFLFLSASESHAQQSLPQTLGLPTGGAQSLESEDGISKRYTVKPASRPKSKEVKKENPPVEKRVETVNTAVTEEAGTKPVEIPIVEKEATLSYLEIKAAPALIYTESKSNYWFRNYNLSSPGVSLDASMWLSNSFGFRFSYISTLGAEIAASPNDYSHTPASQQWFGLALQFRNFDPTDTSSQFIYGLRYNDYQFQVPLDSDFRLRLKTSGVGIFFSAYTPTSKKNKWNYLELEVAPQQKHKEVQTNNSISSGDNAETNSVSLTLGRLHQLMPQNNVYWQVKATLEKTIFSGSASTADPQTTQTPEGVTVTNQTLSLQIGYQWSN